MDQEQIRSNLLSTEHWVRILYMAGYAVGAWAVLLLLCVIIFFQALFVLVGGEVNARLRDAGLMFARYFLEVLRYLVYATEERPWPIGPFPEADEEKASTSPGNKSGSANEATAAAASSQPDSRTAEAFVNKSPAGTAAHADPASEGNAASYMNSGENHFRTDNAPASPYNQNGTPIVPDIPVLTDSAKDKPQEPDQGQKPDHPY